MQDREQEARMRQHEQADPAQHAAQMDAARRVLAAIADAFASPTGYASLRVDIERDGARWKVIIVGGPTQRY
jgi:hypothetical protein